MTTPMTASAYQGACTPPWLPVKRTIALHMIATLDPGGRQVWWFDDDHGNEFGDWRVVDFSAGQVRAAAAGPALPRAYPAGLALGGGFAVLGTAQEQGRSSEGHDDVGGTGPRDI